MEVPLAIVQIPLFISYSHFLCTLILHIEELMFALCMFLPCTCTCMLVSAMHMYMHMPCPAHVHVLVSVLSRLPCTCVPLARLMTGLE